MTIQLIPPKEVVRVTGLSRATLGRLTAEGRFPAPIRLTPRRMAYNSAEVQDWVQARLTNGAV